MAKHYDEDYEVIVIIQPKDNMNKDALRFYLNRAKKDKAIYRLRQFFGLSNFDVHPEIMYEDLLKKFEDRIKKKNFS